MKLKLFKIVAFLCFIAYCVYAQTYNRSITTDRQGGTLLVRTTGADTTANLNFASESNLYTNLVYQINGTMNTAAHDTSNLIIFFEGTVDTGTNRAFWTVIKQDTLRELDSQFPEKSINAGTTGFPILRFRFLGISDNDTITIDTIKTWFINTNYVK